MSKPLTMTEKQWAETERLLDEWIDTRRAPYDSVPFAGLWDEAVALRAALTAAEAQLMRNCDAAVADLRRALEGK